MGNYVRTEGITQRHPHQRAATPKHRPQQQQQQQWACTNTTSTGTHLRDARTSDYLRTKFAFFITLLLGGKRKEKKRCHDMRVANVDMFVYPPTSSKVAREQSVVHR